jgi:hypothetical protein
MKPGYKTTEFWLTFLAMLIGVVMASGVFVEGHWALQVVGMASVVLAKLGYTASRGRTKAADSLGKTSASSE